MKYVIGIMMSSVPFFAVIDINVFQMTEKNLGISVRMSENIG